METQVRLLAMHKKYIIILFIKIPADEQMSYVFGRIWQWVTNGIFFIFGWTIPLATAVSGVYIGYILLCVRNNLTNHMKYNHIMYFSLCSFTCEAFPHTNVCEPSSLKLSFLPSPTETLSIFSFSRLNPSLRYPSTLIYQWFIPLKPSILPVWVSVCYKHAFIHKPQLPEHFLLGLLLALHRRERASTTHCLSKK